MHTWYIYVLLFFFSHSGSEFYHCATVLYAFYIYIFLATMGARSSWCNKICTYLT